MCIKQKSKISRKGKVVAATYAYRADFDGEWGEIKIDFQKDEATIAQLAELDTVEKNRYARRDTAQIQKTMNPGQYANPVCLFPIHRFVAFNVLLERPRQLKV